MRFFFFWVTRNLIYRVIRYWRGSDSGHFSTNNPHHTGLTPLLQIALRGFRIRSSSVPSSFAPTKMNWRLGPSASQIFAGQYTRKFSSAVSAKLMFTLFNGDGHSDSLQSQGIESLKRSLHSSIGEDDDFSELGPPPAQGTDKSLRLVTEKPVSYRKFGLTKKVLRATSSPEKNSSWVIDLIDNHGKSKASPVVDLKNQNDESGSTFSSKNTSNLTHLRTITIKDIPSTIDLSQMVEAISVFGEISSVCMRTMPNGLSCCNIEFKTVESRRRAVSVGGITVRRLHLTICPLRTPATVTIRIKNISNETADPDIYSLCVSFGSLESLARTKEDAVDVFYRVKDDEDLQSILKKLNDTIVDGWQWSAHLLPGDFIPLETSNEDAKCKLGFKISSHLNTMRQQVNMKKIDAEDLEYLHSMIMHLEEIPGPSSPSS